VTPRIYETPASFKRALEDRLKSASTSGVDFARRRQLLVFDRFLARTAVAFGEAVMLKGGLVLELRLERARTTKDVDLRIAGSSKDILARLQAAGALDLGDFIQFEVAPDPETPEIVGDAVQYDGYRFRAECRLAGKIYGARFGVDVAFGGVLTGDVEQITTDDLLGFAGIAPPRLRVVPIETHLAEKLHAYTMPRDRPNTRVKDLPDLALLGTIRPLQAARLREAIERTFGSRRVHQVPARLPSPPDAWAAPYARMAELDDLPWSTLAEVEAVARAFLDPVLGPDAWAEWDPRRWKWRPLDR
jgi:hypothetical protein